MDDVKEIMQNGMLVKIPDTVRVEYDEGTDSKGERRIRRFDKATNRMIPKYVALHVNPLDPAYKPVPPFTYKEFDMQGNHKKLFKVDANTVKLNEKDEIYKPAFTTTYSRYKNGIWKPGESGFRNRPPDAEKMSRALHRALGSLPEYAHLYNEGFQPKPLLMEEIYFAMFNLLLNRSDSQVIFLKRLFSDYEKDPIGTFERIRKLKNGSGLTVLTQFGDGAKQLINVQWTDADGGVPGDASDKDKT